MFKEHLQKCAIALGNIQITSDNICLPVKQIPWNNLPRPQSYMHAQKRKRLTDQVSDGSINRLSRATPRQPEPEEGLGLRTAHCDYSKLQGARGRDALDANEPRGVRAGRHGKGATPRRSGHRSPWRSGRCRTSGSLAKRVRIEVRS